MCEDDPDKAECIREVEEAKATTEVNDVEQEGEARSLVLKFRKCVSQFSALSYTHKTSFYKLRLSRTNSENVFHISDDFISPNKQIETDLLKTGSFDNAIQLAYHYGV